MRQAASSQTDPVAAARTLLELVAELMEESFAVLGEGQIMGTMPAYLERFGAGNARYVAKHFLASDDVNGPISALSPMDLVSRVTGTQYSKETTDAGHLKRLHHCEFLEAFEGRGEFPRSMMCMLHRAAYQGSVNGLVDEAQGFDVQVTRRILFGDDACDFLVSARGDVSPHDGPLPMAHEPGDAERADLAYYFYTFLLTSFVDYLSRHLPDDTVEEITRNVAARVGTKVGQLITDRAGRLDAERTAREVLLRAGRGLDQDSLNVRICPQAEHIAATASGDGDARRRVIANACRLCKHVVSGAVREQHPDAVVEREKSLALGDDHCDFGVRHG